MSACQDIRFSSHGTLVFAYRHIVTYILAFPADCLLKLEKTPYPVLQPCAEYIVLQLCAVALYNSTQYSKFAVAYNFCKGSTPFLYFLLK